MVDHIFERLPSHIRPVNYNLHITTDLEKLSFKGNVVIALKVLESSDFIRLNSLELALSDAVLNIDGTDYQVSGIEYLVEDECAKIKFSSTFPPGDGRLFINFSGKLNTNMKGYYHSVYTLNGSEAHNIAVTQFEPTDARRAFPCWDEPAVKATFNISLTAVSGKTVLSNTDVISTTPFVDGLVTYKFSQTPIMSTYLVAFVVGDFEGISTKTTNGIDVSVYAPIGKSQFGKFALEVASKTLPFYEKYFGIPYPLNKVDLIAIPDFAAGAMENWGLITYRETALLVDPQNTSTSAKEYVALVVGHELAHQWFGNLVTMEWWTHLWLNEGFASWIEYLCVDHNFPNYEIWTEFSTSDFARALELDGMLSSHAIEIPVGHPSEIDQIFDAISYSKGASIIRMINDYIGDDAFRKGLNNYLTSFSYKNAITEDLWYHLSQASVKPVGEIMSTWTSQMGYPVLFVSHYKNQEGVYFNVKQRRFISDGSVTDASLWNVPISLATNDRNGENPFKFLLKSREESFLLGTDISPSWIHINVGSIGFYRVHYSDEMLKMLLPIVPNLKAEERLGIYNDAFTLARAGLSSTTSFLDLFGSIQDEYSPVVWKILSSSIFSVANLLDYVPHPNTYSKSFENFVLKIAKPIFEKVGYDDSSCQLGSHRSHHNQLLRPLLLAILVRCNDPSVISELNNRFNNYRNGGNLDSDLRLITYRCVLKNGTQKELDDLIDLYKSQVSSEEKVRILSSLGSVQSTDLLKQVLEFSLSDYVKGQDVVSVFGGVSSSVSLRSFSWNFVKQNWNLLLEKLGGSSNLLSHIVKNSTFVFFTPTQYSDVETYFSTIDCTKISRVISQSLEQLKLNMAWLERDGSNIVDWISRI